jgi:hypothetical protein
MKDTDTIRVADDLVVVIEEDRLVVRGGDVSVAVMSGEVRHSVDALVEGAAKLVGGQTRDE